MSDGVLRVVQLNAGSLLEPGWDERRHEIVAWLRRLEPDVVCLEEVWEDASTQNTAGWIVDADVRRSATTGRSAAAPFSEPSSGRTRAALRLGRAVRAGRSTTTLPPPADASRTTARSLARRAVGAPARPHRRSRRVRLPPRAGADARPAPPAAGGRDRRDHPRGPRRPRRQPGDRRQAGCDAGDPLRRLQRRARQRRDPLPLRAHRARRADDLLPGRVAGRRRRAGRHAGLARQPDRRGDERPRASGSTTSSSATRSSAGTTPAASSSRGAGVRRRRSPASVASDHAGLVVDVVWPGRPPDFASAEDR